MAEKSRFYLDIQSLQPDVTYSNNLVTVSYPDGTKEMLIVDCGLYQGSRELEARLNPLLGFKPEHLVGIILTHAHVDHSGRIPMLYKNGASCRTYMTEDTMKVAERLLRNTAAIIEGYSVQEKIYSFESVERAIKEFRACDCNEFIEITPHIKAVFIQNQHVPGAATVNLVFSYPGEDDISVVFSGDYNIMNKFSSKETKMPGSLTEQPISMLVLESTYGSRKKEDVKIGIFKQEIAEYAKKGYTIIIPAFAFSRYQTVLKELKELQDEGALSTNIPIFMDGGLGIELTYLWKYLNTVEVKDFLPQNLNVPVDRKALMKKKWQKIIVTTSGMGNFGPAKEYIPNYISCKKALIYLSGYASVESMARKILEAKDGDIITVSGIVCKKHAIVKSTSEFSSHARKEDLVEFVKEFSKINFLLINHGEEEAKNRLAEMCIKMKSVKKVGIIDGMTDFRVNKHGLVKTYRI